MTEAVLVLHGMHRRASSMAGLAASLERAGFRAEAWAYPSGSAPFEVHGASLAARLAEIDREPAVERVHLVGHSLGGIVARHAIATARPRKLGRLVMLAPPNRGSRVARVLAPLLGRVVKPLAQLSSDPASAVNLLAPPLDVEVGVIAAARDGKVRVEDTHLAGEKDHLVVPGFHTFIMNRPEVHEAVERFLRTGAFQKR
jgi:pimeloyl-ACP methyl ester carboxylesterase